MPIVDEPNPALGREPLGNTTLQETRRVESAAAAASTAARGKLGTYEVIERLCGGAARRRSRLVLLSGTPMEHDFDSMYEQLHLLRPETFPSYDAFGERSCQCTWMRGSETVDE